MQFVGTAGCMAGSPPSTPKIDSAACTRDNASRGGGAHGGRSAVAAAALPGVECCPRRRTRACRRAARGTRWRPALPPANDGQRPPPLAVPARCHDQQSGRPARSVSLRPRRQLLAAPLCVCSAPAAADSGLGGGPFPPPVLTRSLSRRREYPHVRQPLRWMSRRCALFVAAAILSVPAGGCAGGLSGGGGPGYRWGLDPVRTAAARHTRFGGNKRTQGCPRRQGGGAPPCTSVRGELLDPSLPSPYPRYGTGQYGLVAMAAADARRAHDCVSTRHTRSPSARGPATASPLPECTVVSRNDKYG